MSGFFLIQLIIWVAIIAVVAYGMYSVAYTGYPVSENRLSGKAYDVVGYTVCGSDLFYILIDKDDKRRRYVVCLVDKTNNFQLFDFHENGKLLVANGKDKDSSDVKVREINY